MTDMVLMGNIANDSVVNGLRVALTSGSWDRCILLGYNMHNASGTKWNLAAGNTNGFAANNITT